MAFPQGYDTSRVLPVAYSCAPPPNVVPVGYPQGRWHTRRRSDGRAVQRHAGPANIETFAPGYCPGSYTPYPQGIPGNPVITENVEQVRRATVPPPPTAAQFLTTQVHLFQPSKNVQGCFELFGRLFCPGK